MKQGSELKLILSEFIRAVKVCTDHASLLRDSADGIEQYLAEIDVPVRAINPPRSILAERIRAKDATAMFLSDNGFADVSYERILSRQYIAALEKIARLSAILESVLTESDERNSPIRGWSIDDLQREADDAWPLPEKGADR